MPVERCRVLCLHGIGTSSEVLEAQLAPLRHLLGQGYEFEFVDGAHPWPAAPGVREVFGHDHACFSYFDGSQSSAVQAIDDLESLLGQGDGYDAILGFSLGGALAATLLLRQTQRGQLSRLRCAIFLCATQPCSWSNEGPAPTLLGAGDVDFCIEMPTLHCWSPQDVEYPGQSEELINMCEARQRLEVRHVGGHAIPTQGDDLRRLVESMRRCFDACGNVGVSA